LSEYKHAAVSYIAGYVVHMARKRISCLQCQAAMVSAESNSAVEVDTENLFVKSKDHGGLIKASKSVLTVCQETENVLTE